MTTVTTRFDNAAIIVDRLPGNHSREDCWSMPSGPALRRLAALLGEGSQVFLFLDWPFGDPYDPDHNMTWHEQFAAEIEKAWGNETPPQIYLDLGHDFKVHGGTVGGPETSERIFGTQTSRPDYHNRPTTPTLIRVMGGEIWDEPLDQSYTSSLCKAIIAELGPDKMGRPRVLQLDPSPEHFDARMNVWLQNAGAFSGVYRQVVHIDDWTEDGEPVIGSIADVSGL